MTKERRSPPVSLVSLKHSENDTRRALFRRLFEAEAGYVWLTLRRLGVRDADIEDLSHELFLKVHHHLDGYDDSRSAKPWLFAFAFRLASDYRRSGYQTRETLGEVERPSDAPLADELLADRDERALLAAALATIDLDRRAVLVAYEMDELPMKEIAASLAIPVNTAYSRLRIAREELAQACVRLSKRGPRP